MGIMSNNQNIKMHSICFALPSIMARFMLNDFTFKSLSQSHGEERLNPSSRLFHCLCRSQLADPSFSAKLFVIVLPPPLAELIYVNELESVEINWSMQNFIHYSSMNTLITG